MKLSRSWAAAGFLSAAGLVRQCKKNAGEIVRIETAMLYLKGVDILREILLYQIGILICSIVLVFGGILIQGAVIFFIPWGPAARLTAALILGSLDFLAALAFLAYFVSSERWLRQAAKFNRCVRDLIEEDGVFGRH